MDESTRARSDSAPVVEEKAKRAVDHDSLVTVRLSEPSYLQISTHVSMNALPSRKSLYEDDYTPVGTKVELVKEEQDEEEGVEGQMDGEAQAQLPVVVASDHTQSLQDELEEEDETLDDTASMHSTSDGTDMELEDVDEDTTPDMDHARSSEETNWDQLQKIEEEESRDQASDNVSLPP